MLIFYRIGLNSLKIKKPHINEVIQGFKINKGELLKTLEDIMRNR